MNLKLLVDVLFTEFNTHYEGGVNPISGKASCICLWPPSSSWPPRACHTLRIEFTTGTSQRRRNQRVESPEHGLTKQEKPSNHSIQSKSQAVSIHNGNRAEQAAVVVAREEQAGEANALACAGCKFYS